MPVTIISPTVGQPTGWGFGVTVTSDVIGPFPIDTRWDYRVFDAEHLETTIMSGSVHWVSQTQSWVLGDQLDGSFAVARAQSEAPHGSLGVLRVDLVEPPGTIRATGQTNVTIDMQTGMPATAALVAQPTVVTGGFTAEDRVVLMGIQGNTQRDWGGGIISPLNLILQMPPLHTLRRWWLGDFSGEGLLNTNGPWLPGFLPHALEVEIVSHPAGIGVNEGAPDALEITYVEFAANWRLFDQHFTITDRLAERAGRVMWQPQPWNPDTIDYYIAPGVVARFWWIGLFLAGPTPPQPP